MKARYALSLLGFAAGAAIADRAAAETYSVTDLGTLSTTPTNNGCGSGPTGINDSAQVVGNYFVDPPTPAGLWRVDPWLSMERWEND